MNYKKKELLFYVSLLILASIVALFLGGLAKASVRDYAALTTMVSTSIAMLITGKYAYLFCKENTEISVKLSWVYATACFMFFCTFLMGYLGFADGSKVQWAFAYNLRTFAVIFEVIALHRFFRIFRI